VTTARKVVQRVSRWFAWASGIFTLAIMILVVVDVVLRDVFTKSLGGTIEISEVLLVFLVFLGVAFAQQAQAHVNTNLVTSRVPPRVARVMKTLGHVIVAGVLLWTTWVTATRGWDAMQAGEARFGLRSVPVWPARLMIPVGLLLLSLETLFTASDAWRADRDGGGLPQADDSAPAGL
jgi:TRAP-type C4-dicarboxylate transport system permease small subunit